jgi:hypothetical protein
MFRGFYDGAVETFSVQSGDWRNQATTLTTGRQCRMQLFPQDIIQRNDGHHNTQRRKERFDGVSPSGVGEGHRAKTKHHQDKRGFKNSSRNRPLKLSKTLPFSSATVSCKSALPVAKLGGSTAGLYAASRRMETVSVAHDNPPP